MADRNARFYKILAMVQNRFKQTGKQLYDFKILQTLPCVLLLADANKELNFPSCFINISAMCIVKRLWQFLYA